MCDSELKELLAPLFPHVRIQHVLPRDRNSDVMDMAIGRNLFPGLVTNSIQLSWIFIIKDRC